MQPSALNHIMYRRALAKLVDDGLIIDKISIHLPQAVIDAIRTWQRTATAPTEASTFVTISPSGGTERFSVMIEIADATRPYYSFNCTADRGDVTTILETLEDTSKNPALTKALAVKASPPKRRRPAKKGGHR
jgi:hypothetical protein